MAARRKQATAKVSVTVTHDDLELLRARAKRIHGGNLSAAIADGVARLREEEATHRLLERLGAPPLSEERFAEILAEWHGSGARPRKRARKTRAA